MILKKADYEALMEARHTQPHAVLGMHPTEVDGKAGLVVRALVRDASTCEVVAYEAEPEERFVLEKVGEDGLFEGFLEDRTEVFSYRLRTETVWGEIRQFYDPYAFLPTLSEQDLYLFNKGDEHFIYRKLGSHMRTIDGVPGVAFAVWAPSAKRVSVVGDFNHWDGRYHPMRSLGSSGVWELFIPGLAPGSKYKFEIHGADGYLHLKTDPYATFFEPPPHNASIVQPEDSFTWSDGAWMEGRQSGDWKTKPISIYEVHLESWKRMYEDGNRPLTYRELADELVAYVKDMGYTHVEMMPVAEHPFSGSWGYQVTGYFAPTNRFGTPEDFKFLINALHEAGIGVIIDWVPAHFPMDSFALAQFDGSHLFEHADPRQGVHQDWGTLIFNYGRHEVRAFLVASALSWFDRYHIDGLRVDAVASMLYLDYSRKEGEWIPNQYGGRENIEAIQFLRQTNDLVHQYYPGALMIAEESTAFAGISKPTEEGGVGFDMKWNMGWMHDTLEYFQKDPVHRKWHHNNLTFGMIYQFSENFTQVFSHDEVVHGKNSMILKMAAGSMTEKAGTLRSLYAFMWMWPGKKTLFMGSDFGQSGEWQYDQSLQWHLLEYKDHEGVQMVVRDLNRLYRELPALHRTDLDPQGFEWLSIGDNESSVIAWQRTDPESGQRLAVIGHFTPMARKGYRVGMTEGGFWREILNTDAHEYGGTGVGNDGGRMADSDGAGGRPFGITLDLPPNSVVVLRHEG